MSTIDIYQDWPNLTPIQKNAVIAEKIMGWQWIPFDFDDVYPMTGQLWLLPDPTATSDITNGEWTWYIEEEEVWPKGSISPLPHKDKHILPIWIPHYISDMDGTITVLRTVTKRNDVDLEELYDAIWGDAWDDLTPLEATEAVCQWTPEQICIAALKAVGCTITN